MAPLTLDDVLPLEEYAAKRAEFFASHRRYLERYRRVRVGPAAAVIFQNRQTLWFKLHEILRVARLADPARVRLELDWYNRLLPARGQLCAALVLDSVAPWDQWAGLEGNDIRLVGGRGEVPARLVTARPEDRCVGWSHWLEFDLGAAERNPLAGRRPVTVAINRAGYLHASAPLTSSVRQSLLDDLALSERDAA
jgi:hypothetical protein